MNARKRIALPIQVSVLVELQRCVDIGVTQYELGIASGRTGILEQCRHSMAKVVQVARGQLSLASQALKRAQQVAWIDGLAGAGEEDEAGSPTLPMTNK